MLTFMFEILLASGLIGCDNSGGNGGPSAQPAEPNGNAGVSVNTAGELVIDAPLYEVEFDNPTDSYDPPQIELVCNTINTAVYAYIYDDPSSVATGTISDGRLKITIPVPDEGVLQSPADYFDYPASWINAAANIKIGLILLENDDGYIRLYADPIPNAFEYGTYYWSYIDGEYYGYLYSEGDVTVFGSGSGTDSHDDPYIADMDVKLTQGWNCGMSIHNYDTGKTVGRSQNPPANAKWVWVK